MTERPENDFDRKWPWPEMTAFLPNTSSLFYPRKKSLFKWRAHSCILTHFFVPLHQQSKESFSCTEVGLHRRLILVLIDDRRRSSMTTKIRARNEASGELKYQQNISPFVWACYDGIGYILNLTIFYISKDIESNDSCSTGFSFAFLQLIKQTICRLKFTFSGNGFLYLRQSVSEFFHQVARWINTMTSVIGEENL